MSYFDEAVGDGRGDEVRRFMHSVCYNMVYYDISYYIIYDIYIYIYIERERERQRERGRERDQEIESGLGRGCRPWARR